MDALPLATAVSIHHESREILAGPVVQEPIAAELRWTSAPDFSGVVLALNHRFLSTHQLLI
jgi:hypothetical protein